MLMFSKSKKEKLYNTTTIVIMDMVYMNVA